MPANSLHARDTGAISDLQKLRFFPQEVSRGEGCYLYDPDGRGYLDLSAGWGAAIRPRPTLRSGRPFRKGWETACSCQRWSSP